MDCNLKMLVPKELKSNIIDGAYQCYGKCLIQITKTLQWRKATMHGRPGYEMYLFEIEPCDEFPDGGMHTLSTDRRWNTDDVRAIRLVPDCMWDLPILQDKLTDTQILIMNLKKRRDAGEKILDKSEHSKANDWKIVCIGNDCKYGRVAYSQSLDVMRGLTFDEFYGGGIVD